MKKLVLAVALMAAATPVSAGNVQELLQQCNSTGHDKKSSEQWFYYVGYVSGIGKSMSMTGATPGSWQVPLLHISLCAKGSLTAGAQRQAFINWATRHPENWDWPDELGVMAAPSETWPCVAPTPRQ